MITVKNLALAAALAAVGIPLAKCPFSKTRSAKGGDQLTFFFEDVSKCGTHNAVELAKAWNDDNWHLANPEHIFGYIKCAFNNRESLLDKVNQSAALVVVEQNGKLAILPEDANEAQQTLIFSRL